MRRHYETSIICFWKRRCLRANWCAGAVGMNTTSRKVSQTFYYRVIWCSTSHWRKKHWAARCLTFVAFFIKHGVFF